MLENKRPCVSIGQVSTGDWQSVEIQPEFISYHKIPTILDNMVYIVL